MRFNFITDRLVEDAAKWYKFNSIRLLGLIALLPDIYNILVQADFFNWFNQGDEISAKFNGLLKTMAALTAIARLLKQRKLETPPE